MLEVELGKVLQGNGQLVETRDNNRRLIGFFTHQQVAKRWGFTDAAYDFKTKGLQIGIALSDRERLDEVRAQLNGGGYHPIDARQRMQLEGERNELRDRIKRPPIEWKRFFRMASSMMPEMDCDDRHAVRVKQIIRGWAKKGDSRGLMNRLVCIQRMQNGAKFDVDGQELYASELVGLIADGDRAATELAIRLLVESYNRAGPESSAPRTGSTLERDAGLAGNESSLPEWVQIERPFVLIWADRSSNLRPSTVVEDTAHYISCRIGRG